MPLSKSLLLSTLALMTATAFAQSDTVVKGVVTDSMCGMHHMIQNVTPAECTRRCVKDGSTYALAVNGKVYALKAQGTNVSFDKFAGQTATVKGQVNGTTILVKSITAGKS
ncbi:MAG TPA: hypothetical protein VM554_02615 [Acidisarcina sp.]|nr:hypothetical protein [Acidisarcina sp.]